MKIWGLLPFPRYVYRHEHDHWLDLCLPHTQLCFSWPQHRLPDTSKTANHSSVSAKLHKLNPVLIHQRPLMFSSNWHFWRADDTARPFHRKHQSPIYHVLNLPDPVPSDRLSCCISSNEWLKNSVKFVPFKSKCFRKKKNGNKYINKLARVYFFSCSASLIQGGAGVCFWQSHMKLLEVTLPFYGVYLQYYSHLKMRQALQ